MRRLVLVETEAVVPFSSGGAAARLADIGDKKDWGMGGG